MRSKERIPVIIDLITKIWVMYPDLRLGQLLGNAVGSFDPYYIEDDKLELLLKENYNV